MGAETHTKRGSPSPLQDAAPEASQLNLAESSMTTNAESGSQLAAHSVLRDQVYDTWIPKWDEEIGGVSPAEWFACAEIEGDICFKAYSPAALRALQDMDRLYWKEECLYEDVLKGISMPLDPARSFAGRAEGPIILVRCPERDVVMVVNGNHRVGAVMREEFNPTNSPLFVVEFANQQVYEQFTGAPLTRTSYLAIDVKEGGATTEMSPCCEAERVGVLRKVSISTISRLAWSAYRTSRESQRLLVHGSFGPIRYIS